MKSINNLSKNSSLVISITLTGIHFEYPYAIMNGRSYFWMYYQLLTFVVMMLATWIPLRERERERGCNSHFLPLLFRHETSSVHRFLQSVHIWGEKKVFNIWTRHSYLVSAFSFSSTGWQSPGIILAQWAKSISATLFSPSQIVKTASNHTSLASQNNILLLLGLLQNNF